MDIQHDEITRPPVEWVGNRYRAVTRKIDPAPATKPMSAALDVVVILADDELDSFTEDLVPQIALRTATTSDPSTASPPDTPTEGGARSCQARDRSRGCGARRGQRIGLPPVTAIRAPEM